MMKNDDMSRFNKFCEAIQPIFDDSGKQPKPEQLKLWFAKVQEKKYTPNEVKRASALIIDQGHAVIRYAVLRDALIQARMETADERKQEKKFCDKCSHGWVMYTEIQHGLAYDYAAECTCWSHRHAELVHRVCGQYQRDYRGYYLGPGVPMTEAPAMPAAPRRQVAELAEAFAC